MTTAQLKIATKLILYKLLLLDLLLVQKKHTSHQSLYRELGWMTLETRRKIHRLRKMYSIINNYPPVYLQNMNAHLIPDHRHNTRFTNSK